MSKRFSFLFLSLLLSAITVLSGCNEKADTGKVASKSPVSKSNSISSTATAPVKAVLTGQDVTGSTGETVSVPFTISANSQIAATDLYIYYNSDVLAYEGFSTCQAFSTNKASNADTLGVIKYTLITLTPITASEPMITVNFKIKGKSGSKSDVTAKFETCFLSDAKTKIDATATKGSVTVK